MFRNISSPIVFFFCIASRLCFADYYNEFEKSCIVYSGKTFTDVQTYNAASHAGSPLGWLESESTDVELNIGYSYLSAPSVLDHAPSTKRFYLPRLRVGKPGIAFFGLQYTPQIISSGASDELPDFSIHLPLQRFGFDIAAGTGSGIFQIGIRTNAFFGKESMDIGSDTRTILGLDDFSLFLGSRVHPLVGIGFRTGARGLLDTLRTETPSVADRFFYGYIPRIGGYIDVSGENIPVKSNFSLLSSTSRFIYVTKGVPNQQPKGNENVIKGDSLGWDWQSLVSIPYNSFQFEPAIRIGYWHHKKQHFEPSSDNHPLNYGAVIEGTERTYRSIGLGIGSTVRAFEIIDGSMEYEYNHFSLDVDESYGSAVSDSRHYHTFRLNVGTQLHRIPQLQFPSSIETLFRTGFINQIRNSVYNPYFSSSQAYLSSITPGSQRARYTPDLPEDERVIGVTFDTIGSFFDSILTGAINVAFLWSTTDQKKPGLEFGSTISYYLRSDK